MRATGLRVSRLALGTVELGLEYGIPATGESRRPSLAEAERALDRGINVIGAARVCASPESWSG